MLDCDSVEYQSPIKANDMPFLKVNPNFFRTSVFHPTERDKHVPLSNISGTAHVNVEVSEVLGR